MNIKNRRFKILLLLASCQWCCRSYSNWYPLQCDRVVEANDSIKTNLRHKERRRKKKLYFVTFHMNTHYFWASIYNAVSQYARQPLIWNKYWTVCVSVTLGTVKLKEKKNERQMTDSIENKKKSKFKKEDRKKSIWKKPTTTTTTAYLIEKM